MHGTGTLVMGHHVQLPDDLLLGAKVDVPHSDYGACDLGHERPCRLDPAENHVLRPPRRKATGDVVRTREGVSAWPGLSSDAHDLQRVCRTGREIGRASCREGPARW